MRSRLRIMARIQETWRGQQEPEYRYRTGYDQRQARESSRYFSYPSSATSEVRNGYQRPYGEVSDGYGRSGYGTAELLGEYRRPYRSSEQSPRGVEYRKPYREGSGDYQKPSAGSKRDTDDSVIVLKVPMCCDKCKEKVQEELGEVEGVESVRCDQYASRVTVRGEGIDVDRCLKKAERAVKKKCELISGDDDDEDDDDDDDDDDKRKSSRRMSMNRTRSGGYPNLDRGRSDDYRGDVERNGSHVRSNSGAMQISGRPSLGRLPSFASGKINYYDGAGHIGQDYEAKDYSGFRRLPSFSKHRHHEAEYISTIPDQRPEFTGSGRDYYAVRRMPSFNRHRHHDAEYITTADPEYSPRTFYEDSGSRYTTVLNERPVCRSQASFSRLPVGNPYYVKQIDGIPLY